MKLQSSLLKSESPHFSRYKNFTYVVYCVKLRKISEKICFKTFSIRQKIITKTYLFQIQENRHVFVVITSGQRRALPPSARIRIEDVADVVPLARIRTLRIANGTSRQLRGLAKGLWALLAACRIYEYIRFRGNVERRRKEAAIFQTLVED